MPTYVYKFVETGETIEVQQSFSDDALTEAVHPGSGAVMEVKKVYTPVGVTFRGNGFYKTDSRGKSSKSSNGSSTSTNTNTGTGTESAGSSSSDSATSSSTTPPTTVSNSGPATSTSKD